MFLILRYKASQCALLLKYYKSLSEATEFQPELITLCLCFFEIWGYYHFAAMLPEYRSMNSFSTWHQQV